MADTFSSTLGVLLMGTGNDNNTWGQNANTSVFQILEDSIANSLTSAVSGGTLDLSGSAPPSGPSQVRYVALIFTGTLTANQIVKVPNLTKWWWVNNQTSGAFTLTIETPSASATGLIPQNSGWQVVQCDGNANIVVSPYNFEQIQMPDGTLAAPSHSFINETGSGLRRAGTQDFRFAINGTDVLQITGPSASTPSVINVLSPQSLQQAGVQIIPPGTELPFAGVSLPTGFLWEYGQAVSRTTYPNLLAALRASFTGDVTNGSNTITSVTTDLRNLGLEGAALEGNGLTGLTISSITSNTITMSGNATAGSGGSQSCVAYPFGNGDGSTTFNVPDRRGRVIAGRDNMGTAGSAAAGRLTSTGGVTGTELTASGGAQTETASTTLAQANLPNVTLSISGDGSSVTVTNSAGTNFIADTGSHGDLVNSPGNGTQQATASFPVNNVASHLTTASINGNVTQTAATSAAFVTVQPTGVGNYIIKT